MLDNGHIPYDVKPFHKDPEWQAIRLTVDESFIQENDNLFQEFANYIRHLATELERTDMTK